MHPTPASRAAAAATVTLLLVVASVAALIYLATEHEEVRPVWLVLVSLAFVVLLVLHLIFVALLAQRCQRPATGYVVGALLTLPIGSAVGLILYEWHARVDSVPDERTT